MPARVTVDDRLIDEVQKLGRHRSKKEAVKAALEEYVRRRKHQGIIALFGTIEYDSHCNYKRERRSNRA